MNKTIYYKRVLKNNIILAKIENRNGSFSGFKFVNGKWVDSTYILGELYEDLGFDEITEAEAKELIEKGLV